MIAAVVADVDGGVVVAVPGVVEEEATGAGEGAVVARARSGVGRVVADVDGGVVAAGTAACVADKVGVSGEGAVGVNRGGQVVVADVDGVVKVRAGPSARIGKCVGAIGEGEVAGAAVGVGDGAVAVGDRKVIFPLPSIPVSATALPSWNNEYPSNEMARSRPDDGAAGRAPPARLSIDDSQSVDESAEAIGVWAAAAPMPTPTASTPSRPIRLAFFIGDPPWPRPR